MLFSDLKLTAQEHSMTNAIHVLTFICYLYCWWIINFGTQVIENEQILKITAVLTETQVPSPEPYRYENEDSENENAQVLDTTAHVRNTGSVANYDSSHHASIEP